MGYDNPLMKLPSTKKLLALPAETRAPLEGLMRELRAESNALANESWAKSKGPMAAYWKAVSTYARHIAIVLAKGFPRPEHGTMPVITDAHRYLAVRNYKDARGDYFGGECDVAVDSFLTHLFASDKHAFFALDRQARFGYPKVLVADEQAAEVAA